MRLYPAIDLKDGQCVRLVKGEMDQATVFSDAPAEQAKVFEVAGCDWLHVIDLNGAFAGKPVNADAVTSILKETGLKVQLGGGIRNIDTIRFWLDQGVERVILGTLALKAPDIVKEACRRFPGRIAVGIDAKGGRVAVEGWAEVSDVTTLDLARKFEDAGVAAIIYTDIDRDGTLTGLNVEATGALAAALSIPVIASGGLSNIDDIKALQKVAKNSGGTIDGAIAGRALYDGRLNLQEALALLKGAAC